MSNHYGKLFYLVGVLFACLLAGCRHEESAADSIGVVPESKLGTRISSVAKVAASEPVAVEGFGLVGGLPGTGSADCPAAIREYLKRYIRMQLPAGGYDFDKLIDSKDTAVVRLEAALPAAAHQKEPFDVRVSLPSRIGGDLSPRRMAVQSRVDAGRQGGHRGQDPGDCRGPRIY